MGCCVIRCLTPPHLGLGEFNIVHHETVNARSDQVAWNKKLKGQRVGMSLGQEYHI